MSTTTGLHDTNGFAGPFSDDTPDMHEEPDTTDQTHGGDGEDDQPDDTDGRDDADDDRSDSKRRTRTNARRRGTEKNLIRRAANKVVELTDADTEDRRLLAGVLGVDDDAVQMTVAILSGDRSALTGVQEVLEIADTNPIERGVVLMSVGRTKMRSIWQMYSDLGVEGIAGSIPGADPKAAMALAKAELSDDVRQRLERVTQLAKKG